MMMGLSRLWYKFLVIDHLYHHSQSIHDKLLRIKTIKAHLQVRLYLFQETLALANSDYLTHINQIGILDVRVEN